MLPVEPSMQKVKLVVLKNHMFQNRDLYLSKTFLKLSTHRDSVTKKTVMNFIFRSSPSKTLLTEALVNELKIWREVRFNIDQNQNSRLNIIRNILGTEKKTFWRNHEFINFFSTLNEKFPNFEWKNSGLWVKKFRQVCQNCILRVKTNIFEEFFRKFRCLHSRNRQITEKKSITEGMIFFS